MINKTTASITRIYTDNLNVRQDDTVLVFTDDVDKKLNEITVRIANTGKAYSKKTRYVEYKATGNHGAEPPEILWRAAFGKNIVNRLQSKKLLAPLLNKKADDSQMKR